MTSYTAETLDLSRLDPAPLVVVDYEATLGARLDLLLEIWERHRKANPLLPALDTANLETEPARILNEEFSYSETLILEAINDTAKQLRLSSAIGPALDQLTATYHGTSRQTLTPATDQTPAVLESDEALRSRAQLAPEALAGFGLTPGSYVYRVKTAFADRVLDVWPINRGGGRIELRILGRDGDGTVAPALLAEIAAAFAPEAASQSTDVLSVLSAEIARQDWIVTLVLPRGPDPAAVAASARAGLTSLAASLHRIGAAIYREAIASAAHVGPVVTVRVDNPAFDLPGHAEAAPFVSSITVRTEVR